MDGHFSEKINMNNCIQKVSLANLEIFRYLCTQLQKKHLACSSGPPMGTKSGQMKILDSHFLNPG